jgi:sigma-B regulation protein RsbU (phosphoserine phosphatase)
MIREQIEGYTWESMAMLAAAVAPDGTVLDANPAFERLAGGPLAGTAFDSLIQTAQRDAFARRLAAAGHEWTGASFALASGGAEIAADRRVWLRRAGDAILVVAEPAVGEQEHLVKKVLELNDELVAAHRALVRQREDLRSASHRIHNLEAISAAGLLDLRLDELLAEVLRIIAEAVGSERAVLLMLDDDGEVLVARAAVGLAADVELAGIRVPLGVGVAGSIAVAAEPRVIPDLSKVDVHSAYLRESSRSMAGVPLTLDGEVIGVLHVSSGELDRFGDVDLRLLVPAAERAALAIGRARIVERERRIAETLQRSLLPEVLPSIEGLELAARFLPGAGVEVGGDWYDALPLPSGELAVVIGDVAGKGLRAATLMGELRAGLRAYAIEGGGPMDTLIRLNRLAQRSFHMATAVLMHVAPDRGRVTFASAGHLPPLLLAADGPARFLEGGASTPLLAMREDIEDGTAALAPGDRVVLYTDGLVERRREPIDESLERLRSAGQGFDGTVEALCDHLIDAMRPPAGAVKDDIALIALERSAGAAAA